MVKSKLEIESESLQQRLKTLDESEHRYKDENWNLETRLQEFNLQQKDAADREKKMNQAMHIYEAEKLKVQKELDEVKLSHAKLAEEHASATKNHDIELGTAKRNMVLAEGEREAMQRKIEDLTNQNQELAKAFSAQRGRILERDPVSGMSDDDFETATDNITPEHSPPPSPIKGTPRHSILETETMKTSLHHAQRTIQSQRSLLHREKTEKLELRRIIQDLRDDLEKARNDGGGSSSNRRSRKVDSKEFKKGSSRLLGSFRSSREEILEDDPAWEENQDVSPRASSANVGETTESSDHFETANEASESAFETANDRATETDDFQTGNEELSGSDGAATETEGTSRGFGRMKRPPVLPAALAQSGNRNSFISTASTSGEEDDLTEVKTPTAALSSQRSKARLSRGPVGRTSRQISEEPNMLSSPASFASSSGTPQQAGQSLFAELQEFEGSDDESVGGATPSRRSTRSITPASTRRFVSPRPSVPALPKVIMVDSGVMTEPINIEAADRPLSMASVFDPSAEHVSTSWLSARDAEEGVSRPVSGLSYGDLNMDEKLAEFPVPPSSPPQMQVPLPVLSVSGIQSQGIEPREELQVPPTPPSLSLVPIAMEGVEPREEPRTPPPVLTLSSIAAEHLQPKAEPVTPPPDLTMTSILAEKVDPVAEPELSLPALGMSAIAGQHVAPVHEREPEVVLAPLTMTSIHAEHIQPREEAEIAPEPTRLAYSNFSVQHVEPVSEPEPTVPVLAMSSIAAEHVHPVMEPIPAPPTLVLSSIAAEKVEPRVEPVESPVLPNFGFSGISSIETQPVAPRSGWRDAFILPRDGDVVMAEKDAPETPPTKTFGAFAGRGKTKQSPTIIAEDETRQSPRDVADSDTPESQRPFKEIASNAAVRAPRKQLLETNDQSAQTSLTADAIDAMITAGHRTSFGHAKSVSVSTTGTAGSSGTVRIHRSPEDLSSPGRGRARVVDEPALEASMRRPGSASSARLSIQDAPPLPSNHRQLIEAARTSSSGGPGSMGPPLWPASAMKQRPQTPSQQRPMSPSSGQGTPTPRAVRSGSRGNADIHSPTRYTSRSRRSSVSSFASELENRFNMRVGELGVDPTGLGPNTDPRMIQAITQTMIGEYLWKYTRKAGRGDFSENRHRRYFWVHPYTRTLYWSERDPSTAGKTELKAKSVPIEAVRVVTDDNPMPPGLHRKSLIVISPGRTIKFTCTTGQRHETWFNALSYLLLRTNKDGQADAEEMVDNITREDVDEFNPQYGQRPGSSRRPRRPPSLSSYNSRTTRNESPSAEVSLAYPSLTPTGQRPPSAHRASTGGTFSKLSGYWKPGKLSGTFSSRRSRMSHNASIYEASEVHDSAEDLREMIERQDREADRLENVRACCDGKMCKVPGMTFMS